MPVVLPYYQHVFDINDLASINEGLGISVVEASACGLPLIVTYFESGKKLVSIEELLTMHYLSTLVIYKLSHPILSVTLTISVKPSSHQRYQIVP